MAAPPIHSQPSSVPRCVPLFRRLTPLRAQVFMDELIGVPQANVDRHQTMYVHYDGIEAGTPPPPTDIPLTPVILCSCVQFSSPAQPSAACHRRTLPPPPLQAKFP